MNLSDGYENTRQWNMIRNCGRHARRIVEQIAASFDSFRRKRRNARRARRRTLLRLTRQNRLRP